MNLSVTPKTCFYFPKAWINYFPHWVSGLSLTVYLSYAATVGNSVLPPFQSQTLGSLKQLLPFSESPSNCSSHLILEWMKRFWCTAGRGLCVQRSFEKTRWCYSTNWGDKGDSVSTKRSKWLHNLMYFMFILHHDCAQGIHPGIPALQQKGFNLEFFGCYKSSIRSQNKLLYLYTELQHRPVIVHQWYQRWGFATVKCISESLWVLMLIDLDR